MRVIDIPKTWRHTRKGVWHEPYPTTRNGITKPEWKIYYEKKCKRCKTPYVTAIKKRPYCTNTCANRAICKFGKNHPRWKNGKAEIASGYVLILKSRKPRKYIFEHRLVMEKFLKRKLKSYEIVHHINGIRNDNKLSNLIVMTRASHASHHHKGTIRS